MAIDWVVPRYDFEAQFADIDGALLPSIRKLLLGGDYILGEPLQELESALAEYLAAPHVVGVNSGTDALVLALDALGIGPGDEVITVANTFHATAMAVLRVGARPVLVDCDPGTYLIDLAQAQSVVTPRTKAIIVVHMFGQAVDLAAASDLAERNGIRLIEDCAQAIGAYSGGRRVGSVGDAGCLSFAPAKNLAAAGDAGAISVRDDETAKRLRLLRHFGQAEQNYHEIVGYNSRLDSIQALVLLHKLALLDSWNRSRAEIAQSYRERLDGLPLAFQDGHKPGEHVYHLFQARTDGRDRLADFLRSAGIDAVVRYPVPLHMQGAFADLGGKPGDFPVAEALARETLCLPLFPSMSSHQVDYVCETVHRFFGGTP